MSCPTCDHTLDGIGHGMFHCPRCGTLAAHPRCLLAVPKLVERCRQFGELLPDEGGLTRDWRRLGIAESIRPPETRIESEEDPETQTRLRW